MGRLNKISVYVLLIGQFICCSIESEKNYETTFKGDLFFKLISFGSLYQADSLAIQKFNTIIDSLYSINPDSLTKGNKEFINIYDGLRKNGLIEKPFFDLKTDSSNTYTVYVDTFEFEKIKNFKHEELINENEKVVIELTGKLVNLGTANVIDCKTIDKVTIVEGKTYWRK